MRINEIDIKGFYRDFLNFGDKLIKQYRDLKAKSIPALPAAKGIVFSGMGGSGIVGDVIKDYLYYSESYNFKKLLLVNKSHILPSHVNEETPLIAISYSGNTAETINVVIEALKRDISVICISSGGKLEELCQEKGLAHIKIHKAMAPRSALPELLAATLRVLEETFNLDFTSDVEEAYNYLVYLKEYWGPSEESRPFKLAREIDGKIPIIYTPHDLISVGIRAKTAFNENAKINAYYDIYPEMFHNEVMAYEEEINSSLLPIFIGGNSKVEVFYRYLLDKRCNVISVEYPSDVGRLAAILKLIKLFDLTSVYLAVLRGVDPYPVRLISWLKEHG